MKIIELMPEFESWPDWAQEAATEGRLFREFMKRLNASMTEVTELHTELDGAYSRCAKYQTIFNDRGIVIDLETDTVLDRREQK